MGIVFLTIPYVWSRYGTSSLFVEIILCVLLTFFIGFRFQIGVDWATYEIIFYDLSRVPFWDALLIGDPAYSAINWVVSELKGQVWHVNLVCGAIFALALVRFCRIFEFPAVAMIAVFPLLIVVTAMGYTRQATAIAFVMMAIISFDGRFNWRWIAWLTAGLMFHKSVFILFPLFILSASRNLITGLIVGGAIVLFLLVNVVLRGLSETLALYVGGGLESSGTLFRIGIGAIAASCFFLIPNRQVVFGSRYILWRNMGYFGFALVPLALAAPSATIIDRTGILLIPLQAAVFSGLITGLGLKPGLRFACILGVILYSAVILGGWLQYAQFASYWIPYRNVLLEPFL